MKKIIFLLLLASGLFISTNTMAQHRSHSSSHSSHHSSSHSSYHSGHYQNGHGSSHKGGHYKNSSTHDHYRTRKH